MNRKAKSHIKINRKIPNLTMKKQVALTLTAKSDNQSSKECKKNNKVKTKQNPEQQVQQRAKLT